MTLLLLCTFDDSGIINSKRSNVNDRINDYICSFKKWFNNNYFKKIIIIENSGYHSDKINDLILQYSNNTLIEFIQFKGQDFDRNLGKGYGVYISLKYLLNNSEYLFKSDKLVIITGRYYITNFRKIIENPKYDLISDFQKNLSYAFNPILFCTTDFLNKYLLNELIYSNDFNGVHYEHCLSKSVHKAISDGIKWSLPKEVPLIDGISGTSNSPYYRNLFHKYMILSYSRIKFYIFNFNR